MVSYQRSDLDDIFHALADTTRRAMVQQMAIGQRTITELARPHDMSFAAASKHVKVLEGAGLVRREVRGRAHLCSLDRRPFEHAANWLRTYLEFWDARLDDLEHLLSERGGKTE